MNNRKWIAAVALLFVFTFMAWGTRAYAAPVKDHPVTLTQPDGTVLECFASGDEFFSYLHDENGYLIKRDPDTGFLVYANLDGAGRLSLTKNVAVSGGKYAAPGQPGRQSVQMPLDAVSRGIGVKHADIDFEINANLITERAYPERQGGSISRRDPQNAALSGVMENIVVMVSFADEDPAIDPEYLTLLEDYFNGAGDGYSGSLKDYINVVSGGVFEINSTIVGMDDATVLMYRDDKPRAYYQPYNEVTNPMGYQTGDNNPDSRIREHTLLKNAIEAIDGSALLAGRNLDFNSDGEVDGVTFIITGDTGEWSELLWPHQWVLYSHNVTLNGLQVFTYSFQIENHLLNTGGVSVLAHESLHTFGFPDLYRYYYAGEPVFAWDIMSANTPNPQIPNTYSRNTYAGWGDTPVEITQNGRYTLSPLGSKTGVTAYTIAMPDSGEYEGEFVMLEYRSYLNNSGFDTWFDETSPRSEYMGLVVSRVYPYAYNGNMFATGYLPQDGFEPDEMYVYRPDEEYYNIGSGLVRQASLSAQTGRTSFGTARLTEDGDDGFVNTIYGIEGYNTGYTITNVSAAGETISFDVRIHHEITCNIHLGKTE